MSQQLLFIDGSVNPQTHVGYGAFLKMQAHEKLLESMADRIKTRRFEKTSSTKLELQTLMWALSQIQGKEEKVLVYTDSQTIVGLPARRERLEQNAYRSAKNVLLNNHELYKEFYKRIDQIDIKFVKVRGHSPSKQKNDVDRLFTLVDKASRRSLKKEYSG